MSFRNREYENLRYYQGIIRDLQAQLNIALARIKQLEDRVKAIPTQVPDRKTNVSLFYNADTARKQAQGTLGLGGLTAGQIKDLVRDWINNGELPVPLHDHTTENTGGDAYANKGAALQ